MSRVSVDFKIDTSRIVNEVNSVIDDRYVRAAIHKLLAEMCDKYVPYDTGYLSEDSVYYTQDGVHYSAEYAHYVYEGLVYGPNIPYIDKNGEQKWASPKGKPKFPTGREMSYQMINHPEATGHWDQVMLQNEGDIFRERVHEIIQRRLKKLNG